MNILALLGLLAGITAHAETAEWQYAVTPYLWLPHVDANLGFESPGSGGSTVEMTNLLEHLRAAMFLNAAAIRGNWGLSVDLVYCDFSRTGSQVTSVGVPGQAAETPLNAGTTTDLTGSMVSLLGSYAARRAPGASFDLLAGLRYTHIAATLDWSFTTPVAGGPASAGSTGMSADLWDGVVGVRGRLRPRDSAWFVPFYVDAGAGTSKFTWQGMTGVGYAFGWGDMLLVYRELEFDGKDAGEVRHLSFSGPALGATFRF